MCLTGTSKVIENWALRRDISDSNFSLQKWEKLMLLKSTVNEWTENTSEIDKKNRGPTMKQLGLFLALFLVPL